MLSLDDDETEVALLALQIAVQEAMGAAAGSTRHGPADRCCQYCARRFSELSKRLERYQAAVAEEKTDGN